jgi:ceramide glucosyltransferase
MRVIGAAALAIGAASVAYLAVATVTTARFGRRRTKRPQRLPFISVLKPVYGTEPGIESDLATFCAQDYPNFEVLFCLHDGDVSGRAAVDRVAIAFPRVARVLIGDGERLHNPKVSNLLKGEAAARGEIVAIADSDVSVDASYLRAIAAEFDDSKVGAVSSIYRGVGRTNWISQLAATYASDWFAPSVLVANEFAPVRFCLGAALAVRADALRAIGGLRACGDTVADDYRLGWLVAERGFAVRIARYVVTTAAFETTLADLWTHELRWGRTNVALNPGYAFTFVTRAVPLTLLALAISGNVSIGVPLAAAAVGFRTALHYVSANALGERPPSPLWMMPLRDCFGLAVWACSFGSKSVRWRGAEMTIEPDAGVR